MDSTTIEYAIFEADISTGAALEGGCGPIARAIRDVFGGQYAVVVDCDGYPRHAAVYTNGILFDGTGKTTVETLCSLFVEDFTDEEVTEYEGQSVDECTYIQLCDTLSEFRRDPALTQEVTTALQESVDQVA